MLPRRRRLRAGARVRDHRRAVPDDRRRARGRAGSATRRSRRCARRARARSGRHGAARRSWRRRSSRAAICAAAADTSPSKRPATIRAAADGRRHPAARRTASTKAWRSSRRLLERGPVAPRRDRAARLERRRAGAGGRLPRRRARGRRGGRAGRLGGGRGRAAGIRHARAEPHSGADAARRDLRRRRPRGDDVQRAGAAGRRVHRGRRRRPRRGSSPKISSRASRGSARTSSGSAARSCCSASRIPTRSSPTRLSGESPFMSTDLARRIAVRRAPRAEPRRRSRTKRRSSGCSPTAAAADEPAKTESPAKPMPRRVERRAPLRDERERDRSRQHPRRLRRAAAAAAARDVGGRRSRSEHRRSTTSRSRPAPPRPAADAAARPISTACSAACATQSAKRSGLDEAEKEYKRGLALRAAGDIDGCIEALEKASRAPKLRFGTASLIARLYREREHDAAGARVARARRAGAGADAPTRRTSCSTSSPTRSRQVGEMARALAVCIELQADAGDVPRRRRSAIDRLTKVQAGGLTAVPPACSTSRSSSRSACCSSCCRGAGVLGAQLLRDGAGRALRAILSNNFVRGAVSGLGVVNLFAGFADLALSSFTPRDAIAPRHRCTTTTR